MPRPPVARPRGLEIAVAARADRVRQQFLHLGRFGVSRRPEGGDERSPLRTSSDGEANGRRNQSARSAHAAVRAGRLARSGSPWLQRVLVVRGSVRLCTSTSGVGQSVHPHHRSEQEQDNDIDDLDHGAHRRTCRVLVGVSHGMHGSEALAFHVEGLVDDGGAILSPRSIDAIRADPELADWRRDLVLIPLLLDRGSSWRVNISLDRVVA